jgi:O-antigen/teichoic acid export membrane protein
VALPVYIAVEVQRQPFTVLLQQYKRSHQISCHRLASDRTPSLEEVEVKGQIRGNFVRDSSLFSITLVLRGISYAIRSFFIAKLLGPQGFGIWRFVNIFVEYIHFVSLGTQPAMQRAIPFLRGKGEMTQLQLVLKTVSSTNLLFPIIYTAVIFGSSSLLDDSSTANALMAFCPVILILAWMRYSHEFLLATAQYALRRRVEAVDMVVGVILSVSLVYFFGIYGAIAAVGISGLVAIFLSARQLSEYLSLEIDWHILGSLIVMGFPILADTLLMITMANSDRILIAAMMSRESLGVYSVGAAGVGILGAIPSAFGQMLFVKFAEMDGLNSSKGHIFEVLDRTTVILSCVWAPILCLAIGFFPLAIEFLLPEYVAGIGPGKVLIAAVFFLGVSLPANKWCISTGRYSAVLVLRVVVVAAEFAGIYVLINSGVRLEVIAFCVLCSFAIFNVGTILLCNHFLEKSLWIGINSVAKSTLPFLSIFVALITQEYMYSISAGPTAFNLFLSCFVGLVISLVASIPFLVWANYRTQLFDLVLSGFGRLAVVK